MKPTYRIGAATLLVAVLGLQGCAMGTDSNNAYIPGQARREQTVRFGTVDSVRNVVIGRKQAGAGTITGGAIGDIGSAATTGRGNGSVAVGVSGAILGGAAGSALEGQMNKRPGLETTVKLDNGEYRAIAQDADEAFRPGERVRLLSSGGVTRATY